MVGAQRQHPGRALGHVGLNLLYLVPGAVGGSEIYARELVRALGAARPDLRFTTYCGQEAGASLRDAGWPANVTVRPVRFRAAVKPVRALAEVAYLPLRARRDGVELLHSLGTTSPPFTPGVVSVVTILDLIYDVYPETFPPLARAGLRLLVGPGARRSDRVITISESVKGDVVGRLGVPAERIDPVLLGRGLTEPTTPTPEAALRERLALGEDPVVLCVSAALAHKNLPRLLGAFAAVRDRPALRLVLAGHAGLEQDRLRARAAELGVADRVVFPGWIEQADLEGLYALATVCVYPSLHEGFGMPVLEAMSRGVPLVCSDATSLPEVAGDAAVLVDPTDVEAIAAGLRAVLDDPELAARLTELGRRRAAEFTWERCAAGVLETYERTWAARS